MLYWIIKFAISRRKIFSIFISKPTHTPSKRKCPITTLRCSYNVGWRDPWLVLSEQVLFYLCGQQLTYMTQTRCPNQMGRSWNHGMVVYIQMEHGPPTCMWYGQNHLHYISWSGFLLGVVWWSKASVVHMISIINSNVQDKYLTFKPAGTRTTHSHALRNNGRGVDELTFDKFNGDYFKLSRADMMVQTILWSFLFC